MRTLAVALALQLTAAGCAPTVSRDAPWSRDGAVLLGELDRDRDGLCDPTEAQLGTNPSEADTDGDGLPDAIEAIAGLDPQSRSDPSPDHIAHLAAADGELAFDIALTVEGYGQAVNGELIAGNALDIDGRTASDFYRGGQAIGGDPPDNVRNIMADEGRIGTVAGLTRVQYRLHFARDLDVHLSCVAGLPFDFALKDDRGNYLVRESYLLVVSADMAMPDPDQYCRPAACI